jgi:4-amino-4-deoxy-L-arabinose transferase-like glycosyltransferase
MESMKRTHWFLLVCILIVAGFFRLYHLSSTPPGLYPDEAVNATNAASAIRAGFPAGWHAFYSENNGREGLFMNLQSLSMQAFGIREPWVLRLPSTLFGILTVLGVFLLGRELWGVRVGLLASFFLATNVWHIIFSRIGFRAIMAPFFITFALFFLLRACKRTHWGWATLAGITYGLGFYSYLAYRVTPVLLLPLLWAYRDRIALKRVWIPFVLATIFVCLPLGLYFLGHPQDFTGRTGSLSIFHDAHPVVSLLWNTTKTIGMFFVAGDFNPRHNIPGRPELFWPVAILFAIGVIAFLKRAVRGELASRLVLLLFALAFLPVVLSNEGVPHALRSILMIPSVMLAAGLGASLAIDYLRPRLPQKLGIIALIFILPLLVLEGYETYFVQYGDAEATYSAFSYDYTLLAHFIRDDAKKPAYLLLSGGGIDITAWDPKTQSVRTLGAPLSSQVLMYITDTFTPEDQQKKQIFYIPLGESDRVPPEATVYAIQ